MQKSFIAIALALTLTSAFAAYTPSNFVSGPVVAAADSDTNYTNQTAPAPLTLASVNSNNLYLVSGNLTANTGNVSASNWNLFYRQLNAKTLAGTQNNSISIVAPSSISFSNNYAIGFAVDNSTGFFNLYAYQTPLTTGTVVPGRIQLSNNTNVNFTVTFLGTQQIGNTIYVFYVAANNTANFTSFTVGATTLGPQYTLSSTFDTPNSFSVTWGEALGSSQVFAVWIENKVLKDAVINVAKGTVPTPTVIPGYNSSLQAACQAVATDKSLYGEFCVGVDSVSLNILYFVRTTTNGSLIQIANYTANSSAVVDIVPYGQYLAVFFQDSTASSGVNYAYEIWNLATFNTTSVQARKQYLNIDSNSTQIPFRVVSGGYYTLLYNNKLQANGTITNVQVGLVLGSSYLASVLGFLLTIVAGLFLF
jgi:hypothetical protein